MASLQLDAVASVCLRAVTEKFTEVTILFSDIASFTDIAAAVEPTSIISMLDDIYCRFDKLTTVHDVYKVSSVATKAGTRA